MALNKHEDAAPVVGAQASTLESTLSIMAKSPEDSDGAQRTR